MPDILSPEARSERMSRIRGSDTKPELWLRKAMHARGFRYVLGEGGFLDDQISCCRSTEPSSSCMAAFGICTVA